MARDLPDVWRDEDGPSAVDLARWTSGELRQITLDQDGRRVVRQALKSAYSSSTSGDRAVIDHVLGQLKR